MKKMSKSPVNTNYKLADWPITKSMSRQIKKVIHHTFSYIKC